MKDRLIITLPITPYNMMSVGKMTTPILGETLAKSLDAKFVMSINQLSSYDNREYYQFLELLKRYEIIPHEFWIDSLNTEKLLEKIYTLIGEGYIKLKEKRIIRCKCGKVEIPCDNLKSINYADSLIIKYEDKFYCKCCKEKCIEEVNETLVFDSKKLDKQSMKFYPKFINKDKVTFDNTVGNNDIVISRKRNTGISICICNKHYNLDIDFVWEVFLSLFSEKEKIVICSNHQLYQLYMVGMLEKCFDKESNTICLATPYLHRGICENNLENRIISLKLFSIFSQKWAAKENTFDVGLLKYINSMNIDKKQMLYDIIVESEDCFDDLEKELQYVLTKKYNFQNANNELKRRRKND